LFDSFSRDARSNVCDAEDACAIREGRSASLTRIVEQVRTRYEEQNVGFPVSDAFVSDFYDRLPGDAMRPYVCEVDGEFAGGSIVLDDGDRVYGWPGSVCPEVEYDVNDLLHWHVIRAAARDGRTAYDLVGANDARLSRFNAKFAPTLRRYHELSLSGPGTTLAERLYKRVGK
jgi:CelD/BcsL family acetyltransferase involved in cellulose biosynthesis